MGKHRHALSRADVVGAALRNVMRDGEPGLGVQRVAASLGIRAPSLYNHVASQEELRAAVAIEGWRMLSEALHGALRSDAAKQDPVLAVASAFRKFAKAQPGLYQLMSVARVEHDDAAFRPVADGLFLVFAQAFAPQALSQDQFVHAIRALRAAVHGFVHLEINGQFGMPYDVDLSFEWMVCALKPVVAQTRH